MIVNRTALARPPAQDEAFEILAFVNEISSIAFFREEQMRLDLRRLRLEIRDESAQVGQLHLLRCVLELIDGADKVHVVRSVLP